MSVLQPWATCLIRLGWGLALVLAPAWVRLSRPLDRTCLETCWVLMVQAPAGFLQLRPTPLLLPTQASSTSVSSNQLLWHHGITQRNVLNVPRLSHHISFEEITTHSRLRLSRNKHPYRIFKSRQFCLTNAFPLFYNVVVTFVLLLTFAASIY